MADGVVVRSPRVLVVADRLVAEAVCVALVEQGLPATSQSWRVSARADSPLSTARGADGAEVGLLISDLDTERRVDAARDVLLAHPLRWVVLTGAPRGPLWGSVLSVDAQVVLRNDASLEDVTQVLRDLPDDRHEPRRDGRGPLIKAWEDLRTSRLETVERVASLSPREHEILRMLYRGDRVARIAATLGVADATVRSQVKALLRKLGVNSQVGAVAAYGALRARRVRTDDQNGVSAGHGHDIDRPVP